MEKTIQRIQNSEYGFTLVEIIVTLVILGILVTTVLVKFINLSDSSEMAACITNQHSLTTAQTLYFLTKLENEETGYYAESLNDLIPYIIGDQIPRCPSDGTYILLPEGQITCTIENHQR